MYTIYHTKSSIIRVSLKLFIMSHFLRPIFTKEMLELPAIVISANAERYSNTYSILTNIGFNVTRQQPIHYTSQILDKKLTNAINHNVHMKETLGLNGKIRVVIESPQDRKYFSNRLAFLKAIETQIAHSIEFSIISRELGWVFFFEDDIKLHESFQSPNKQCKLLLLV